MNERNVDSGSLDPQDWERFRAEAHRVLDACVDHLAGAREHPWRPVPDETKAALRLSDGTEGEGYAAVADELISKVLPYGTGNTHPRFFGWVHGTGLASSLMAEMVATAMNSNCGGRDHGAVYVEREVLKWCRECFGFPATSSGVLVAGTSQATVIALAVARQKALGNASRKQGIRHGPSLTAYAAEGVHNAIYKAMELLGLGSDALRRIPVDAQHGGMCLSSLTQQMAADRAAGLQPFCVIGTAGSVDCGAFDDLEALADLCAHEKLWLHVDGAFGAWLKIGGEPWHGLVRGLERADSLATDFHKWMFVQYDCGMVLVRNEVDHRAAFAARPAYLESQAAGVGGGDPWFCDYGTDLSRGFRALKVWTAIRCHGSKAFGAAVTRNCELATLMGRLVEQSPRLRLITPVRSNICCFTLKDANAAGSQNVRAVHELQMRGIAVFSTTKINGQAVIRAAITNHRTRDSDVELAVEGVLDACQALPD